MYYQANTLQFPGMRRRTERADRPQVGDDCIATGARWKYFLHARAAASRHEAASLGGMVVRQWRSIP